MASGIGHTLREARRTSGMTLTHVARRTKIRETFLAAMERDDFDTLPLDRVYVRGNLRTYAEFLGLDAAELVARYVEQRTPTAERQRSGVRAAAVRVVAVLIVLLVLGAAGAAGALILGRGPAAAPWVGDRIAPHAGDVAAPTTDGATPGVDSADAVDSAIVTGATGAAPSEDPSDSAAVLSSPTSDATPPPDPAPTADPAAADTTQIRLVFRQGSWARVTVDGTQVFVGTVPEGTTQRYRVEERLEARLGNPQGVGFVLDGERLGAVGDDGSGSTTVVCTISDDTCDVAG